MEKLYTAQMIAEIIPKSVYTIREMILSGKFGETYNDGRQHLVYESELKKHLERHTSRSTPYPRNYSSGRSRKKLDSEPIKLKDIFKIG